MKSFKEFITEAKQVGTLYHYTSDFSAGNILSNIQKTTVIKEETVATRAINRPKEIKKNLGFNLDDTVGCVFSMCL